MISRGIFGLVILLGSIISANGQLSTSDSLLLTKTLEFLDDSILVHYNSQCFGGNQLYIQPIYIQDSTSEQDGRVIALDGDTIYIANKQLIVVKLREAFMVGQSELLFINYYVLPDRIKCVIGFNEYCSIKGLTCWFSSDGYELISFNR